MPLALSRAAGGGNRYDADAGRAIADGDDAAFPSMIGLSVAVGRFVEALFWAIFRVAGVVAGGVLLAAVTAIVVWIVVRRLWRRR